MDRSLLLLMKLRVLGLLRRWKKVLSKPKGIILAVVTSTFFVPWILSMLMTGRLDVKPPLEQIRRFGPLVLFLVTILSVAFSAGEQLLYYSPAEVTFLFAGPYRRRQLLGYKLFQTVLLCLFSALIFTLAGRMVTGRLISGFVGSFCLMMFLHLMQMAIGLAGSTLGALAWSRGRRLILVGVVVLLGLAALSAGREIAGAGFLEALQRIERSPVASVVLTPFRWFVFAFTAERVWPDLAWWSALSASVDVALLVLILALDASFLEAASAASARRFARLQRLGGGGGGLRSMRRRPTGRFRLRLPNPPWWGGVGPNFWRQMTVAVGDPARLIGVLSMLMAAPATLIVIAPKDPQQAAHLPYICMGLIAWSSILLSFLLPYDFRGDIDMMEELKGLPIAPNRLALGQLLTPALVATAAQALSMVVVFVGLGGRDFVTWTFLAFLLPVNFLLYAIENLLFLWYPSRIKVGQFDVVAIGRQMLMMMAKMLGLTIGLGLAALGGVVIYFVAGRSITPAIIAAWLTMVVCSLAVLPLVGQAFSRFDVSSDIPA